MKFSELYFGHADAETEALRDGESFVRGYFDFGGKIAAMADERRFLLLGPKGSGKTALAIFMKVLSDDVSEFVDFLNLDDVPIMEVPKFKTGDSVGISRTVDAWKFLLCCSVLNCVLKDQGSMIHGNCEASAVIDQLRRYGFLDPTPKRAILDASKNTIKITMPAGVSFTRESGRSLHLRHVLPFLQKWVKDENRSGTRHLVVLDGLDSILINSEEYIPTISALVQAAYKMNQDLLAANSNCQILILLRNDVFARLSLPDGGKIERDWAVELDWRVLSGSAIDSPLFDLANKKAISRTSRSDNIDIMSNFFPRFIEFRGSRSNNSRIDSASYFLNLTRHTPRDLLQLFEFIRRASEQDGTGTYMAELPLKTIREGVLQYSTKYFVTAIRNELVGVGKNEDVSQIIVDTLRGLGKRMFERREFVRVLDERVSTSEIRIEPDQALRWLFYAGAIGNYVSNNRQNYLQFYHRRGEGDIYLGGKLVLHNALVYGWQLPWN